MNVLWSMTLTVSLLITSFHIKSRSTLLRHRVPTRTKNLVAALRININMHRLKWTFLPLDGTKPCTRGLQRLKSSGTLCVHVFFSFTFSALGRSFSESPSSAGRRGEKQRQVEKNNWPSCLKKHFVFCDLRLFQPRHVDGGDHRGSSHLKKQTKHFLSVLFFHPQPPLLLLSLVLSPLANPLSTSQ